MRGLRTTLMVAAVLLCQEVRGQIAPPDAAVSWGTLFRKADPPVIGNVPHPAVARINVRERDGIAFGSGTLIDIEGDQGLVITNWHVVRDAAGPIEVVFPDGFRSQAKVLKTDRDWDLAALVIWRPKVAPVALAANAAQLGETLTIAGYGSGDFRSVTARCTQYVSPGHQLPYEMVEVSAEARQGDSGGPILNQRGEIAGVLFGAGGGTTSGSYVGRVRWFIASVSPRLADPSTTPQHANIASNNPFVAPGAAGATMQTASIAKPAPDGWHAAKPSSRPPEDTAVVSNDMQPVNIMQPVRATKSSSQITFGTLPDDDPPAPDERYADPTVTTEPEHPLFSRPLPNPQHAPGELGRSAAPVAQAHAEMAPLPSDTGRPLWQLLLGDNLLAQGKSLLAIVGLGWVLTHCFKSAPPPAE